MFSSWPVTAFVAGVKISSGSAAERFGGGVGRCRSARIRVLDHDSNRLHKFQRDPCRSVQVRINPAGEVRMVSAVEQVDDLGHPLARGTDQRVRANGARPVSALTYQARETDVIDYGALQPGLLIAMFLLRCLSGGVLMGWGTLLIPGANDGLILVGGVLICASFCTVKLGLTL